MEMFEQELQLEKKSSWGPLILVVALVGTIVGVIGYYALELKKGFSPAEATTLIEAQLKTRVPVLHFHSGKVVANVDDQPKDPHYKVLEKAGFVKLTNVSWNTNMVAITEAGDKAFSSIEGFKKWKDPDGNWSYDVPLATRKLVKIESIEMKGPSAAVVAYEWKWVPNTIGNLFDASSDNLKTFNTWDRQKLIDKYGADFYNTPAKKEVLNFNKGDKGWQITTAY